MAAAAAGAFALTSGTGFAVSPGATAGVSQYSGLRGASQQGPQASDSLCGTVLGLAGLGALAAAAVSSKTRQRLAMKGIYEERKMLPGGFAGGLAGTKYHGYGTYEFDPAGLSEIFPENLAWFREAELKHGRVAMLAFLGLLVPDVVRFPIEQLQDQGLNIVNAHNKLIGPGLGEGPMWWLLIASGVIESFRFKQVGLGFEKLTTENAGDLGIKLFAPSNKEGMDQMRVKELKNGRLAMLAFGGALTQATVWDQPHFPFAALVGTPYTMPGSV